MSQDDDAISVFLNFIIIILNLLFKILLLLSFTASKIKVFFILMCVHTRERGSSPGFVGV